MKELELLLMCYHRALRLRSHGVKRWSPSARPRVRISRKSSAVQSSFSFCTAFSAISGVEENERTKNTGRSKLCFWDPLAHFEVEEGRNFGSGCMSQNSRFHHVLSVSVVPSCHRVGHVVIKFSTEGIFNQQSLEICCFSLKFEPSLHFYDNSWDK